MKRQRKTTELLDWEELEEAPNTRGAFSFLRPQSPVINIQEHRQQELEGAADPRRNNKTYTVDNPSTVDVPASKPAPLKRTRPYKVHRCYTVQDGHSAGENQLHSALWRSGVSDVSATNDPDTKRVTMGWDRMARKAGMSDKAAKRNLMLLIEKLAVDLIASEISATRTGRTYRVYSYTAILQRRTTAGMLYVVRDKGVRFLTETEMASFSMKETQEPTHKTSTVDITHTVDKASPATGDKTSTDTGDITSTPLRSSLRNKERKTTTTDILLAPIVEALARYVIADENAAAQIVSGSLFACESASAEEIVSVIHEKAPAIVRNRAIENPLGLLIRAVPKCFEGSGILQLRRQWAAEKERVAAREVERQRQNEEFYELVRRERRQSEATLADPASTEKQKAAASKQLAQLVNYDDHDAKHI
jgi:hypothetical protein